jgi:hypothetical protein
MKMVGPQKMLKDGSIRLKADADKMLYVRECCSQHGRRHCNNFGGKMSFQVVNIAKFVKPLLL